MSSGEWIKSDRLEKPDFAPFELLRFQRRSRHEQVDLEP
jgi:hypothetical protein